MVNILVIEDYEPMRKLCAISLNRSGFSKVTAVSCHESLADLRQTIPDIIFVDISLHDIIGLRVINYLVEHERFVNTQLVCVTGSDQRDRLAQGYGIEHFLMKPVSMLALTTLMKRLTGAVNCSAA